MSEHHGGGDAAPKGKAAAPEPKSRTRWWLAAAGAVVLGGLAYAWPSRGPDAGGQEIIVYKSPTCGCCEEWISHVKRRGFRVVARDVSDLGAIKRQSGVPSSLASCHTATVGGYAIEGHVPADLIVRMLKEQPPIAGLAVPGMPGGSPGMESAPKVRYNVIAFDGKGGTSLYDSR